MKAFFGGSFRRLEMATKDFDAHETKKLPTPVKFTKRDGEKVRFTAAKPTRVEKHVHFETKRSPKRS